MGEKKQKKTLDIFSYSEIWFRMNQYESSWLSGPFCPHTRRWLEFTSLFGAFQMSRKTWMVGDGPQSFLDPLDKRSQRHHLLLFGEDSKYDAPSAFRLFCTADSGTRACFERAASRERESRSATLRGEFLDRPLGASLLILQL